MRAQKILSQLRSRRTLWPAATRMTLTASPCSPLGQWRSSFPSTFCGQCGADVSDLRQSVRARYDHIDLPPIRPIVTLVELMGGRCRCGCPSAQGSACFLCICITLTTSALSGCRG